MSRSDSCSSFFNSLAPRAWQSSIPKARLSRSKNHTRLATSANYARFTIPLTFPEVGVAWYLDSDALPLADLAGTDYKRFVRSGATLQAAIRPGNIAKTFDPAVVPIYQARHGRPLLLRAPSWNAGVWLSNFSQWQKLGVTEEAAFWVDQANSVTAAGGSLWKLNTQPIMYLVFHDAVSRASQFLDEEWNCEVVSTNFKVPGRAPRGCKVLHWNGADKPWQSASKGHDVWINYLPRFADPKCVVKGAGASAPTWHQAAEAPATVTAISKPTAPAHDSNFEAANNSVATPEKADPTSAVPYSTARESAGARKPEEPVHGEVELPPQTVDLDPRTVDHESHAQTVDLKTPPKAIDVSLPLQTVDLETPFVIPDRPTKSAAAPAVTETRPRAGPHPKHVNDNVAMAETARSACDSENFQGPSTADAILYAACAGCGLMLLCTVCYATCLCAYAEQLEREHPALRGRGSGRAPRSASTTPSNGCCQCRRIMRRNFLMTDSLANMFSSLHERVMTTTACGR